MTCATSNQRLYHVREYGHAWGEWKCLFDSCENLLLFYATEKLFHTLCPSIKEEVDVFINKEERKLVGELLGL